VDMVLNSNQKPYIWESFRPGMIPIPRDQETYYDEVFPFFSCRMHKLTLPTL